MMKTLRLAVSQLVMAAVMAAAPASGTPEVHVLQFDPSQTKVEFTLSDVLHTVRGTFALKRGNMRVDPASGEVSGELVVDAKSGNSGSGARDRRMHANVLESARFPEIVFRPDRVEGKLSGVGNSELKLHGIFSIHGADHEVTIPVKVQAGDGQYSAMGTFSVPYASWGMKNPSTLFLRVADHVDITIHTIAHMPPVATN